MKVLLYRKSVVSAGEGTHRAPPKRPGALEAEGVGGGGSSLIGNQGRADASPAGESKRSNPGRCVFLNLTRFTTRSGRETLPGAGRPGGRSAGLLCRA